MEISYLSCFYAIIITTTIIAIYISIITIANTKIKNKSTLRALSEIKSFSRQQ